MTIHQIQARLRGVADAWLASIDQVDVRELARSGAFIAGGALASLLLGEEPNDYDIYFTSRETAHRVAAYYVFRYNLGQQPPAQASVLLTDDAIVIEPPSGRRQMDPAADDAQLAAAGYDEFEPYFVTPNAITLRGGVQLVFRFWGAPPRVLEQFDFVHTKNAYRIWEDSLLLDPAALKSLLTRELIYTGGGFPLCSMVRSRKFIERGWRINAGQYLKMAVELQQYDLSSLTVLSGQLTGVDWHEFMHLLARLTATREGVRGDIVNMEVLRQLLDELFG